MPFGHCSTAALNTKYFIMFFLLLSINTGCNLFSKESNNPVSSNTLTTNNFNTTTSFDTGNTTSNYQTTNIIIDTTSDSTNNTPIPSLTIYQFSGTIDLIMGTAPFPVSMGDVITGTFSFDPNVKDTYILSNQGGYLQKAPAEVKIKFGSFIFTSNLNNWLGYTIEIMDNESSVNPIRDTFQWAVNDTISASTYGLDYIQASFLLQDLTASVFNSDKMPSNIGINDFSSKSLFLSGTKIIINIPNVLWNLRFQITSITKVQ